MLRHLRFAPAVAFALLAMAFVGLWVRSYELYEGLSTPVGNGHLAGVEHCQGIVTSHISRFDPQRVIVGKWNWTTQKAAVYDETMDYFKTSSALNLGFHLTVRPGGRTVVSLPHWFLALTSLGLAALLAFKPITRFTVRGLLFTTTLLAAVLGAVVYAV